MTITVSIETALALKKAGWTKECEFSYLQDEGEEIIDGKIVKTDRNRIYGGTPFLTHNLADNTKISVLYTKIAEAPTAQELLDSMQTIIAYKNATFTLEIHKTNSEYLCRYNSILRERRYEEWHKDSIAEALASLWINHPECRKQSIAQNTNKE
jgi:hypothetical protein